MEPCGKDGKRELADVTLGIYDSLWSTSEQKGELVLGQLLRLITVLALHFWRTSQRLGHQTCPLCSFLGKQSGGPWNLNKADFHIKAEETQPGMGGGSDDFRVKYLNTWCLGEASLQLGPLRLGRRGGEPLAALFA